MWFVVAGRKILFSASRRDLAEKMLGKLERNGTRGATVTDKKPRT